VKSLSHRLQQARGALEPVFSVSELSAAAGALQGGVPSTVLRELRYLSPFAPLTVPLGVLTEMIADGVPPRPAAAKVREPVAGGATSAQLIEMGAQVRTDVACGIAPGTALELRSKRVCSLLAAPFTPAITTPSGPSAVVRTAGRGAGGRYWSFLSRCSGCWQRPHERRLHRACRRLAGWRPGWMPGARASSRRFARRSAPGSSEPAPRAPGAS
jgi:hypothetical protein